MKEKIYQCPTLLEKIIHWERAISNEVPYLETPSGLFLGLDFNQNDGYFCTPVDSFKFARPGVDGIHYVLLTDFDLIDDLNEAPVVRVSPMESNYVKIVARNIRDFFSLQFYDELILINNYLNQEEYDAHVQSSTSEDKNSEWFNHDRWNQEKHKVLIAFQREFNLSPIQSPFQYIQDIQTERELRVKMTGQEPLGIWAGHGEMTPEDEEILTSIRQLQFSACFDPDLVEKYAIELIQLGLPKMAEKLRICLA